MNKAIAIKTKVFYMLRTEKIVFLIFSLFTLYFLTGCTAAATKAVVSNEAISLMPETIGKKIVTNTINADWIDNPYLINDNGNTVYLDIKDIDTLLVFGHECVMLALDYSDKNHIDVKGKIKCHNLTTTYKEFASALNSVGASNLTVYLAHHDERTIIKERLMLDSFQDKYRLKQ